MIDLKETYLQKPWGDSLEDITIDDVKTAIIELKEMDVQHAAFWVGFNTDENVLETNKDLIVVGVFDDEPETEIEYQGKSWSEIEHLYHLFLNGDFFTLKTHLETGE